MRPFLAPMVGAIPVSLACLLVPAAALAVTLVNADDRRHVVFVKDEGQSHERVVEPRVDEVVEDACGVCHIEVEGIRDRRLPPRYGANHGRRAVHSTIRFPGLTP